MNHLQRSLSEAADKPEGSIFARLGLDAKELLGLPIEKQLDAIAGAWTKIPIAADKARVGQEIFGKQAAQILPMLAKGPQALADSMQEAGEIGAVVTQEMADQAKAGTKALKEMKFAIEFAFHALGGALLAPATEGMATYGKTISTVAKQVREWIEEHKGLVQTVAGVGIGLMATGGALMIIGKAVTVIGGGFGPIFKLLSGGAGMVKGLLFGAFSLAIVAVKGLFFGDACSLKPGWVVGGCIGRLNHLVGTNNRIRQEGDQDYRGWVRLSRQGRRQRLEHPQNHVWKPGRHLPQDLGRHHFRCQEWRSRGGI